MQKQLHTAFASKNDDELRDSGTQSLKGDKVGIVELKNVLALPRGSTSPSAAALMPIFEEVLNVV